MPTRIRTAWPKPDHATIALQRSCLALDAGKRAIDIVYHEVISQSSTKWPKDRFSRLQQGKDDGLLRNVAHSSRVLDAILDVLHCP